jgi:hypothetical protein
MDSRPCVMFKPGDFHSRNWDTSENTCKGSSSCEIVEVPSPW